MTQLLAAMARRDFLVARSYRLPFVADLAWGVIDLVLYYFISKVVGPVPGADLDGAPSYFAFALVGILVSLVIGTATGEIAGRIRDEQLTGTLELLCAQPLRAGQLAAGYAAYPIAFAIVRVAIYFVIAAFVLEPGDRLRRLARRRRHAPRFGRSPSAASGILAAAATIVFKRGEAVVDAAVFAMTFVSGALFPISVLPVVGPDDRRRDAHAGSPSTGCATRSSRERGGARARSCSPRWGSSGSRSRPGCSPPRSGTRSARARWPSIERAGLCLRLAPGFNRSDAGASRTPTPTSSTSASTTRSCSCT